MLTCSRCHEKPEAYYARYSNQRFCQQCFTAFIEKRVQHTLSRYSMLKRDDRVAVAVSGGKDSVALLHILHRIERKFPKATLIAVTIDEGIINYREEALNIARENCRQLNIEHHVFSLQQFFHCTLDDLVERRRSLNLHQTPCAYCGVLRRRALNTAARAVGATKLATGHTLDDQAQTGLMNILQGNMANLTRWGPGPTYSNERFIPRIKPLAESPENEVVLYAYFKGISFQRQPCPYSGEALRNKAREFLSNLEVTNPGAKYKIIRSLENVKKTLESNAVSNLASCLRCGEPSSCPLCGSCSIMEQLDIPITPTPK